MSEVLSFPAKPGSAAALSAPSGEANSRFIAIAEKGRWVKGVWTVDTSTPCAHRHRTVETARACLRPPWGYEPVGQVIELLADGARRLVEYPRPPRYHETVGRSGRVEVTARRWYGLEETPDAARPIEITFRCGDYESTWWAPDGFAFRQVDGMALALNTLLAGLPVSQVVAIWQAMQREPDVEQSNNVTRLR